MKAINWEEIDDGTGSGNDLPRGGYVMRITKVEDLEDHTNNYGDTYDGIRIVFEVAEGPQAGFFAKYDKPEFTHEYEFKYSGKDVLDWQPKQFKQFWSKTLPQSNPGFEWDMNPASLNGKLFGCTIRHYLYQKQDGGDGERTEVQGFYSADYIRQGKFKEPVDRIQRGYTPPAQRAEAPAEAPAEATPAYELPF
ncbi:hypothetical protein [Paratractidigestivibacter sp.]|uniref:hypothetical protein n=1 Tax=Paratractidigestivibacter sp. TaxID=2847316 RepID=UPI002ABDF496|nr:hypothetical protein [Paratractidigestivibacter sp.]